eukprot:14096878-Alexandrium_andersonii.AAC.1
MPQAVSSDLEPHAPSTRRTALRAVPPVRGSALQGPPTFTESEPRRRPFWHVASALTAAFCS